MNLAKFPRRGYVTEPTPLEALPNFSKALGADINIYIKRDDLLPGTAGGNKTRKLDFSMADAINQGADTIITCGAVQSNHCRLTLAWAVKEGLDCHLVLEERVKDSYNPEASGNNFLFQLLGVKSVTVVPGGSNMLGEMEKLAEKLRAEGKKPYIVPGGASNKIGALGYVSCAEEVLRQLFDRGLAIDHMVVPSGSAGTHAGIIAGMAVALNVLVYLGLDGILWVLRVPEEIIPLMKEYLRIIFLGITATFLYNYFANLLRAIGNSVVPLLFLAVSAVLNVILDLVCVLVWHWGVRGAAAATTFSQFVSGIGIGLYTLKKFPQLCPKKEDCRWDKQNLATILNLSVMTSVQQSIMNFGILMVQGLVNSFGTVIMAAFAAAVKIDSFAYMPVQDFGNAFSTYVAQNYGAGQTDRIRKGIRSAGGCSAAFCIVISVLVCAFAAPLMGIFIDPAETAILAAGVHYLHIEGACYLGIGILFLLYGYYRAVNQPQMSVVLTIVSLGTRVALAYLLSATPLGVTGIWLSVPIGWALADAIGIGYYLKKHRATYAVQA